MSRDVRIMEQYNANDIQTIYLVSYSDKDSSIKDCGYAIVILDTGIELDTHWESNVVCSCPLLAPLAIKYADIVDLYTELTSALSTSSERVIGYYSQYSSSQAKDYVVDNSMIGSIVAEALTRAEVRGENGGKAHSHQSTQVR